jgi:hypothetical protein
MVQGLEDEAGLTAARYSCYDCETGLEVYVH